MKQRTYFVFLLVGVFVVPSLVACIPFGDPFSVSLGESFRDALIRHSFISQFAQGGSTNSPAVNTSLYRLPQNLKPTKYDLTVVPFLVEANFTFYGKAIISITAVQNASEIVLNNQYLTIRSVVLIDDANVSIDCSYSVDTAYQRLTIKPTNASLTVNRSYEVTIEYTGLLQDDMLGFYRSSYNVGTQVKWLAITQFSPTNARRAFPCFDEPAFRAVFTIHVGRFEYQNSISNMRLKSTSEKLVEFENRVIDTYEDTPSMPTYLVAFCVGELVSVTSSDRKFTVWTRENAEDQTMYMLSVGETILKAISDFVNIPYTMPKLDVIAVPDFYFGAMENWGMTTFKERYVLLEEGISRAMDKQLLLTVVSHEFGHQWFGNLVTPQWWSYTWLKEAFAVYFQYNVPDMIEPQWGMTSLFLLETVQRALLADAYSRSPMTKEEFTPAEILAGFNYAPYYKGGSVVSMTEHFLSKPVFRTGLNYYLTNSSTSGIGTPDQLFRALDAAAKEKNALPSGITVADLLNGWTTQGGFPLLTVNQTGNDTLSLSQKIFTATAGEIVTPTFWYVPLSYTNQSEANFQNTSAKDWLLPGANKTISMSDSGWVIFNIQQTGFYRVNYDTNNWDLLTLQLLQDLYKIHVNNRAQLLDDAFNLAETGHVDYRVPLNLTTYLSQEREFVPWFSAMRNMKYLMQRLVGTSAGLSLEEHAVSLVRPYYQYLMAINSSSETHQTSLGRTDFVEWACDLGISECETYAKNAFSLWLNYGVPIGANVKAGILCTGLKLGSDLEWDAVWNLYLNTNNNGEQIMALKALGCTRSENSIQKYLSKLVSPNSEIRKQDQLTVCTSITSRQTGIPPTLRFLVNNFDAIFQTFGMEMVIQIMSTVAAYIVQDEHIKQVRDVVDNETTPVLLRPLFNFTLTSAEANKQWAADHQDEIQLWFNQTKTSNGTHLIPSRINILLYLLILFIVYIRNHV